MARVWQWWIDGWIMFQCATVLMAKGNVGQSGAKLSVSSPVPEEWMEPFRVNGSEPADLLHLAYPALKKSLAWDDQNHFVPNY